jgi:putative nucleotidyltransferase with HDIG domain
MDVNLKPTELKPGMILADDVMTLQGQRIAKAGDVLNNSLISKITFYSIASVTIRSEEPEKEEKTAMPAPGAKTGTETISYAQKLKRTEVYQNFQIDYSRNIAIMRGLFSRIIRLDHPKVDFKSILRDVSSLFAQKTTLDLFDILQTMTSLDDAVYVHSLNVALIARGIGRWMNLDSETLSLITLAGYFHDIGKLAIPPEILNKQGKLTDEEFEIQKSHALEGKKILAKIPNIDSRILASALQHHERNDGSGYPRGLSGDEIDPIASVIAVADVYDAMTTARVYRGPLCAFQVISAFERDGIQKYSPKVVLTFLSRLAGAYQNARVMLNDGRRCTVVYIHHHHNMSRPIVQFDDGTIADLMNEPSLSIKAII